MRKNFILGILFFCVISIRAQKVSYIFIDVHFKTDKFYLGKAEQEKIKQVLDTLVKDRIRLVQMAGHTDSRADSLYNIELSKKRAGATADYFVALGIPSEKIKPGFFGENRPESDNVSETGLQRNRRVEIRITYEGLKKAAPPERRKDTSATTIVKKDTCADQDTTMYLSSGIVLRMTLCNAQKLNDCVKVKTISNSAELLASGLRMRDASGNYLESDGMFSLEWNSQCTSCKDFSADWLLTREEYEKLGFGFYEYDTTNRNWDNIPKKRIERVVIKGQVFYKYKLDCNAFGNGFNKDKPCFNKDRKSAYTKIKVNPNWELEFYATDSTSDYFFASVYDTTENVERKKVWKVPPMKNGTVGVRNKRTGEVVAIALLALKPARIKFLRHKLVTSFQGGWDRESPRKGWPHLNTAVVRIYPDKEYPRYFRKYKITERVIKRARQ